MKEEITVSVVQCARCGVAVAALSAAICNGCQFAYCGSHGDGSDHACEDVCRDCEDDFEDHFWGAPLFG